MGTGRRKQKDWKVLIKNIFPRFFANYLFMLLSPMTVPTQTRRISMYLFN